MKLYILLALWLATAYSDTENIFVAQLTSEGARSNIGPNPFEKQWPFGENEITSMGLRQHYLVGYDLRENYADQLGVQGIYSPWQVNVRSTNHNVTLMGAQSELEAIFRPNVRPDLRESQATLAVPPGDNSTIIDDIKALGNKIMPENFQTLPIHAMDFDKDTVLMGDWCHKIYEDNTQNVQNMEWVNKISEKYADALKAFKDFSKSDNMTIHEIYPYLDGVYASKFNLDDISSLSGQYDNLMAFRLEYLEKLWSGEQSRKILSAGFFDDLQRYMEDAMKQYEDKEIDDYNRMKLALYFGTTEISYVVIRQLGYNHTTFPEFASQTLFELNRDAEAGYTVSVKYNKFPLVLGGECNDTISCPYKNFVNYLSAIKASDADLAGCKPKEPVNFLGAGNYVEDIFSSNLMICLLAYALISGLIAIIFGYRMLHRRVTRKIYAGPKDPEALLD